MGTYIYMDIMKYTTAVDSVLSFLERYVITNLNLWIKNMKFIEMIIFIHLITFKFSQDHSYN